MRPVNFFIDPTYPTHLYEAGLVGGKVIAFREATQFCATIISSKLDIDLVNMLILHARFAWQTLGLAHDQEDLDVRISQSPDYSLTNPQDSHTKL